MQCATWSHELPRGLDWYSVIGTAVQGPQACNVGMLTRGATGHANVLCKYKILLAISEADHSHAAAPTSYVLHLTQIPLTRLGRVSVIWWAQLPQRYLGFGVIKSWMVNSGDLSSSWSVNRYLSALLDQSQGGPSTSLQSPCPQLLTRRSFCCSESTLHEPMGNWKNSSLISRVMLFTSSSALWWKFRYLAQNLPCLCFYSPELLFQQSE